MNLKEKQWAFSWLVGALLLKAHEIGFNVALGEAWRSPEEAARLARKGSGIKNSLHIQKLAIDLDLFKEGKLLLLSEQYKDLGEWWEKQSTKDFTCCWGGRFKRADGRHFSIEHNGVK